MAESTPLKALMLNATLKAPGDSKASSTDRMLALMAGEFADQGVTSEVIRLTAFDIKPGVTSDEGDGDQWPTIRQKILESDILVAGTPIWMGQPTSVIKRAIERMDAFLGEKDDEGRMVTYGRAAAVAVVGNEDGAHHVSAELFQALNDVGFSLAPNAVAYWVGEAMHGTDFTDLDTPPETVMSAVRMATRSTAHLARRLKSEGYPSVA